MDEGTMAPFSPEYRRAETAMAKAQAEVDKVCADFGFVNYNDWIRVSKHVSVTGVLPPA